MAKRATVFEFNEIKNNRKELTSARKKKSSARLNITFEDVDHHQPKLKTLQLGSKFL